MFYMLILKIGTRGR